MTKNITHKPKVVLFDWDNTIVSTNNLFGTVLSITLKKLNMSDDCFKSAAYKETKNMSVRDSFPLMFGGNWEKIWDVYRECYEEHVDSKGGLCMLDGAKEFLQQLHDDNVKMGIVSNKHHDLVVKEIDRLGITHLLTSIVGSGVAISDKPSADHAFHAMKEIEGFLEVSPQSDKECWLVGDSHIDVLCAINAGYLPVLFNDIAKHSLSKQYVKMRQVDHIIAETFDELHSIYSNLK